MTLVTKTEARSAEDAAGSKTQIQPNRIIDNAAMQAMKPLNLTPLRARALLRSRQDGLQWPGHFLRPDKGLARAYPYLLRHGLVEMVDDGTVWSGRSRGSGKTFRRYRLTDLGRQITPPPLLPAPVLEPHTVAELRPENIRNIHNWFRFRLAGRGRVTICACDGSTGGNHVTVWQRHDGSMAYSPESLAQDLYYHIRLSLPRSVITSMRVYAPRQYAPDEARKADPRPWWEWEPRRKAIPVETSSFIRQLRIVSWVAVTFYIAGDPIPLLPAPPPKPPLPAAWTVGAAYVRHCLEVIDDRLAVWESLTPEGQAALLVLYRTRAESWIPLKGVSDSVLRKLNHELLIFLVGGEAKISGRGVDLVELLAGVDADDTDDPPVVLSAPTGPTWPRVDDRLWQTGETDTEEETAVHEAQDYARRLDEAQHPLDEAQHTLDEAQRPLDEAPATEAAGEEVAS